MDSREAEAFYFDRFIALSGIEIDATSHKDKPDFRFDAGGKRIGLEITRFSPEVPFGVPRPETQHSLRTRTMNLARRAYHAEGGRPLHVQASFSESSPLSKKRAPVLAKEIADFFLVHASSLIEYQSSNFGPQFDRPFLPEILSP